MFALSPWPLAGFRAAQRSLAAQRSDVPRSGPARVSFVRSWAARGRANDLGDTDLPGILQGRQIHDGPPHGPSMTRTAIIRDHATSDVRVTAAIVHPGIGMTEAAERNRQAAGLAGLAGRRVAW